MKQKRDSILFEREEVRRALQDRPGPFARVLAGETCNPPPIWLMRQAGRYLPEYREIRKNVGSFLDLCFNPKLATEVTLQPVRRFDFDAAILFSDILVIPHALQRNVRFVEGEGPRLDPIDVHDIMKMSSTLTPGALDPVFETVASVREQLDETKSLIGFCGAPWTVATYMVAGRGTPDQKPARMLASEKPDVFRTLIDKLVSASTEYLIDQLRAGADVIQIFDTWAGVLGEDDFDEWCVRPTTMIVSQVRDAFPSARIIGFPKGAGLKIKRYVEETKVDAIGIDWTEPLDAVRDMIGNSAAIQGNLDPLVLLTGGRALDESIDRILDRLSDKRYIFNLGHGILPTTPIAHVERLVERVRKGGTPT